MSNKPFLGILPSTWVYGILILLTFVTYSIGEQGLGGLQISLLVLGIAIIKGHLVGSYFMGLGQLRGLWRWPVSAWLIIPGALIATAFTLSY